MKGKKNLWDYKNIQQQGRLYVMLGTQCLCLMSVPVSCVMGHFWKKKKVMKCDLNLT